MMVNQDKFNMHRVIFHSEHDTLRQLQHCLGTIQGVSQPDLADADADHSRQVHSEQEQWQPQHCLGDIQGDSQQEPTR